MPKPKLKTIDVKGRLYVTVNERLRYFREAYPEHSLITDLVEVNDDHALIKASILNKEGRILAQGTSYERSGSSFINKGSHVENGETSAWGRALGNFGIGIDEAVASAEEVSNAIVNRKPEQKPFLASKQMIKEIETLTEALGGTVDQVYATYGIVGNPTKDQASTIIRVLLAKTEILKRELDAHP